LIWKNRRIVAFDTETTGLDPLEGDRIIEFGAVVFQKGPGGKLTIVKHNWLINPERFVPRLITDLTGISNEDVADAPLFVDVAPQIHELLCDAVTVAHNYPFDLSFLAQEFERIGSWWPEPLAEVDTIDLSHRVFPGSKSHNLTSLCERVGVTLEQAHRATDDAGACGRCFLKLVGRHKVDDDLQVMLDWAGAIGRPPETGVLTTNERGTPIFASGDLEGEAIADHPIHLSWMRNARVLTSKGWKLRYDEQTRLWLARWLQTRGSGRTKPSIKKLGPEDWGLDDYVANSLGSSSMGIDEQQGDLTMFGEIS
jgi:DNA polymerase III epsilon subunit family exonuclease